MRLKKYRIVKDRIFGYQAQEWSIWWPFWEQICFNSHKTIDEAIEYINMRKGVVVWKDNLKTTVSYIKE